MASDHPILGRLEALVSRYRDDLARLTPELAHLRSEREVVMQYLSEFGTALNALISARQASDDKAAAEGKRADTAETKNASLEAQIAADEATLKGMLDAADAEVAKETTSASTGSSSTTDPVTTTTASGATVTVDPLAGTTTHVDPVASITTMVDHETGTATAVDNSTSPATPVEPAPAVVAEATAAAAAAGVDVPVQA